MDSFQGRFGFWARILAKIRVPFPVLNKDLLKALVQLLRLFPGFLSKFRKGLPLGSFFKLKLLGAGRPFLKPRKGPRAIPIFLGLVPEPRNRLVTFFKKKAIPFSFPVKGDRGKKGFHSLIFLGQGFLTKKPFFLERFFWGLKRFWGLKMAQKGNFGPDH